MIYHDPDDPERLYFTEDEVHTSRCGEKHYVGEEEGGVWFEVFEADCSICGANIHRDAKYPLCPKHEASSRAGGKMLADAQRYPDPERMTR